MPRIASKPSSFSQKKATPNAKAQARPMSEDADELLDDTNMDLDNELGGFISERCQAQRCMSSDELSFT